VSKGLGEFGVGKRRARACVREWIRVLVVERQRREKSGCVVRVWRKITEEWSVH
jgi:hypothetical protein